MSTLFMIGNGFDLNCGMRTSYRQMIPQYIQTDSNSEQIKKFKNEIEKDLDTWGDFEVAMAGYAEKTRDATAFLACLNDFSSFMIRYLQDEEAHLKKH